MNNDYTDSGKNNNVTNCCLTELVIKQRLVNILRRFISNKSFYSCEETNYKFVCFFFYFFQARKGISSLGYHFV